MPKGPKVLENRTRWALNQTYDNTSSVGIQQNSTKQSLPHYSYGKSQR